MDATNPQGIVVAQRIDTTGWESALLEVRVHSKSSSANDHLDVAAYAHGYTLDDPSADFSPANTAPQVALVPNVVAPNSAAVDHRVVALDPKFSGLVKVMLLAYRTSGSVPSTFTFRISIDLTLKAGAEARAMAARQPGVFLGYGPGR